MMFSPAEKVIKIVTLQAQSIDFLQQQSRTRGHVMMVAHQALVVCNRAVDEFPVTGWIGVAAYAQTLLGLLHKPSAIHIVAVRAAIVAVRGMPIQPRLNQGGPFEASLGAGHAGEEISFIANCRLGCARLWDALEKEGQDTVVSLL